MTVADNTSRNQYTATSGQTVFAYTFEIVDKDDVVVLKNGTTLSEGTDYTVSNVGNDSGGNVTLTVGATAGDILTLYRDMPYSRTQNYTNSGDFLASEVNSDFDNLWLAGEQTNRAFSQSIRKPITDSDSISMELPEAATRADRFLTFDSTGAVTATAVSSATAPQNIYRQQMTGDGTTTAFTLNFDSGSVGGAIVIYIDGVYQEGDTYSASGTSLVFTEAPPTNASIEVMYFKVAVAADIDATGTIYSQQFTGNGSTTAYTLGIPPGSTGKALQIFINGVYQDQGSYTVSGATLTFSEAPPNTSQIDVIAFRIKEIGATDANLVTYTPAGTGAVPTTVQTKLRESVSVKDFGAVGDGVTDDTAAIQAAANYAEANNLGLIVSIDTTFRIPTDFTTLQAALDSVLRSENSVQATLNIESGHQLTKGLEVRNGDFGFFKITSTDATVLLSPSFQGVAITDPEYVVGNVLASTNDPLFYGYDCVMPQLFCSIDMNNLYGEGYLVINSKGFIAENCGVINAGERGLNARNSQIFANLANFSGANGTGLRCQLASNVTAGGANFNNCCKTLYQSDGAIYISRGCGVELRGATATNSGGWGLTVRRSIVSAREVDVSNAVGRGFSIESCSIVDLIETVADSVTGTGAWVREGSIASLQTAQITNSTSVDVKVDSGAKVVFNNLTETTSGTGTATLPDIVGITFFNVQADGLVQLDDAPDIITNFTSGTLRSTRYADGTQIISGTVTVSFLSSTLMYEPVSLPQAFLNTDYSVQVTLPTGTGDWGVAADQANVYFPGFSSKAAASINITLLGTGFTASSEVQNVSVTMIGRWQ